VPIDLALMIMGGVLIGGGAAWRRSASLADPEPAATLPRAIVA
jgi:hypothetical protein